MNFTQGLVTGGNRTKTKHKRNQELSLTINKMAWQSWEVF